MAPRTRPLHSLQSGATFTLPPGGEVTDGTLLECPPEMDAKVLVNGKVQYWAATTEVYPGRSEETQPISPTTKKIPTMAKTATATKSVTPKAPKTTTPAKAASTNGNGKVGTPKKDGLRSAQVRILQFLAKHKGEHASRKLIAEKAPCDLAFCTEFLGSDDTAKRQHNDTKQGGFPSLVTLGLVKTLTIEGERGTCYSITAAGRKAAEKAGK